MKVIVDSLVEASKLGTSNALNYIKTGLEAYKKVEIPIVSEDGLAYYGLRKPYEEDKAIQTFVDFMLVYLDEAIKGFEKGKGE
ncbi:MAG: hypothetical protein IKF82_00950 [Bacilli bacterium]|nr:hypothetical protein [Bacilli bacterium]